MTTARDGHLPCPGWSPTNQRMVTHQKEVCYRLGIWHFDLTHKLRPVDNCQECSPTTLRMVTHQPKDGHPPEGCMLLTRNLALTLNSQNYGQVTIVRVGHLPSLGWSPTRRILALRKGWSLTLKTKSCLLFF